MTIAVNDNLTLTTFSNTNTPTQLEKNEIGKFLFNHLDQYGDPIEEIMKAIEYSSSIHPGQGGFILSMKEENEIVGAVVVNKTGMSGYIPEYILVYIAVNADKRGMGIGKKLMTAALKTANGDVALHVEPDNPAKFLYEKLGFENKYLEMRYKKS